MAWDDGDRPRSLALPFNLDLFPVTAVVVVAAIGVFVGQEAFHKEITPFAMDFDRMWNHREHHLLLREPWRYLGACFPHGGILHLLFNVLFTVRFGRWIEGRFGSWKTALMLCYFALVANGAQAGLSGPGIGLSGVLYGMFGFLFVMTDYDTGELHGRLDPQTAQWLIGWFFLGWVLSFTGIMAIGNVAHGFGGLAGFLLAKAMVSGHARRPWWIAGCVAAAGYSVLVSAVIFPQANYHYWFGWG